MSLHRPNPLDDVGERFFGIGQRHQVVQVLTGDAGPTQVIGNPLRLDARRKRFHLREIIAIEGRGCSRSTWTTPCITQRIALANPHEVVQRLAAGDEVVLGERLEPVHRRVVGENRFIVLGRAGRDRNRARGALTCRGAAERHQGAPLNER